MAIKFGWLLGERTREKRGSETDEEPVGFTICDREGVPLAGRDLMQWAATNLEWDIVKRLVEVSTSRSEHVVVTPLVRAYVGPRRVATWQQSWKVVSHASVTFQVILSVEDRAPSVLRMRMTQHPPLEFPPVEPGLEQVLRRFAGAELVEATADVAALETKGRSYSFRPQQAWEPGLLPEESGEHVYYTTSREMRSMVAESLGAGP
jgi:hypothetical protein